MSIRPGMTHESFKSFGGPPATKPSLIATILPFSMMIDWLAAAALPGSAIKCTAWITVVAASSGVTDMAASNAPATSLTIIGKFTPLFFCEAWYGVRVVVRQIAGIANGKAAWISLGQVARSNGHLAITPGNVQNIGCLAETGYVPS